MAAQHATTVMIADLQAKRRLTFPPLHDRFFVINADLSWPYGQYGGRHLEAYAKLSLKKNRPMAARNDDAKVFSGLL